MFDATYDDNAKTLTCKFSGRMDTVNSKEVEEGVKKKVEEASTNNPDLKVVFDLDAVDYIASSFIRICLVTAKDLNEGSFSVVNTKPLIKKTFKVAGLDDPLNVS